MSKNDDIYGKLEQAINDIEIPEKLKPENIMETIKEQQAKDSINPREKDIRTKIFSFRNYKQLCTVAAAVVLVAAVGVLGGIGLLGTDNTVSKDYSINEAANQSDNMGAKAIPGGDMMIATGNISSYDEIYKKAKASLAAEDVNIWNEIYGIESNSVTTGSDGVTFDGVDKLGLADTQYVSEGGYSSTNVQTDGVDEADLIKTDGKYIYYGLRNLNKIAIYEANGEEAKQVCEFYVEGMGAFDEFYIDGNLLIAVGSSYRDNGDEINITLYDITDKSAPKKTADYSQTGYLNSTRKIGDTLYILATKTLDGGLLKKNDPSTYIPMICGNLIPEDSIYMVEDVDNSLFYTVMSSVNVTKELALIDTAAVYGFSGQLYMGNDSIYLYKSNYEETVIKKIPYSDGDFKEISEGKVPGSIKDTFAINENKGFLRVMTTSEKMTKEGYYTTVNNVFILDESMSIVGSVEGLAEGERIYSARYMGDVAYFVTYKETDPLFSVDLSDPVNPKIMGALKIPGFSEYLHSYSDELLLGIGLEIVTEDNYLSREYVKLSMFNTSDPYNVTEENKMLIEEMTYSEALYDYKLVMIDPVRNIFGFTGYEFGTGNELYKAFTYTGTGFREVVSEKLEDDGSNARSIYIGDYIYLFTNDDVKVYSIEDVK